MAVKIMWTCHDWAKAVAARTARDLKDHEGRYGGLFGSTVYRAVGMVLQSTRTSAQEAVQRAKLYGLAEHLDEAVADVTRALDAVRAAGYHGRLVRTSRSSIRLQVLRTMVSS
jgi:hypothetical protein